MKSQTIDKINTEMKKDKNPYVQVIGQFLLQHVESNPGSAEKIMAKDKTIIKSLAAMQTEAQKKKVGNCAVLTDQEGFAIVLKYFGIEGTVETSTPAKKEHNEQQAESTPTKSDNFDIKLEDLL
jgi:hypothetical protein